MSRVEELITELCPDGVMVKRLGEISDLVRGNGMPKSDLTDEGIGAIHYGQIYTHYGAWATRTLSHVTPETSKRLVKANPSDIIVTNTSENLEDVGKAVAWLGDQPIVTGGHATVIRHTEDPKFLSYWFQTESFAIQKRALASGTKVIDVSARQLAKVRVPVPPLEVQREIVRILDTFTELEAELEAELDARRRQYEHYRYLALRSEESGLTAIGELGRWHGGITPSKAESRFWESGSIPWLASMDVSDPRNEIRGRVTEAALAETSLKVFPERSVVVVARSNILRRRLPVGFTAMPTTVNQDVKALVPRQGVDAEYAYQAIRAASEQIRATCVRTDGSMAAVDTAAFLDFTIPLPPLHRQREVAEQLRYFDALVNDLSVGLPAELAARRKQYEYYRDTLLTFKELEE